MATSEPAPADAPEDQRRLKAPYVYIDASVYKKARFDWSGREMAGLEDLAKRGLIRVIATSVNRREVRSLLGEIADEIEKHLRDKTVALNQIGLSDVPDRVADKEFCVREMYGHFDSWLRRCYVVECVYEANLIQIMDDYFERRPPFTDKKKHEFPDAVAVSMLRAWCVHERQSAYVVTADRDLEGCCSKDGPLFFAPSIGAILSHAKVSVRLHDKISEAIRESDTVWKRLKEHATHLDVVFLAGYEFGAKYEIETRTVTLEEMEVGETEVEEFDAQYMKCAAYVTASLRVQAEVIREAVQYSEDEWDPGYVGTDWINFTEDMKVVVEASLDADGNVQIDEAYFDAHRLVVPFDDIARQLM